MRAMILKEFRELRRDRRTLGMMIVMPLLLLVVFGYAANFYVSHVKTADRRSAGGRGRGDAARVLRRHHHRADVDRRRTPSSCCRTARSTSSS